MKKNYSAKLKKIKMLVSDVDGVLTDGGAYYSDEGIELKKFNIRDGMGIVLLQKAGFRVAIVTTEKTKIVERRAERLKVTDLHQGVINKVVAVEALMEKYSLTWQEVAFIGDDINDLPVLKKVGFSAAPANATDINKKVADYVCKNNGGHGAVREVCDLLLSIKWKGEAIADLWLKQQ
jgi:YrbI family 3-deoxy-D-manno-octulosonate 8-phosphate phosphatase